jgi:hypothetical protein
MGVTGHWLGYVDEVGAMGWLVDVGKDAKMDCYVKTVLLHPNKSVLNHVSQCYTRSLARARACVLACVLTLRTTRHTMTHTHVR